MPLPSPRINECLEKPLLLALGTLVVKFYKLAMALTAENLSLPNPALDITTNKQGGRKSLVCEGKSCCAVTEDVKYFTRLFPMLLSGAFKWQCFPQPTLTSIKVYHQCERLAWR